jgi:hypothetical protein
MPSIRDTPIESGFFEPLDHSELAAAPRSALTSQRGSDLGAIAVSDELAVLFHSAKALLDSVLVDPNVPANQRAQVLNSVLSILERITKTRTDLYNSERIREIEQTLLRVMRDQPQELKEAFMSQYEASLATG